MIVKKITLTETSSSAPSIQNGPGGLYVAWKGDGNNFINIMSYDGGTKLGEKYTSTETTSQAPILVASSDPASNSARLYLMWTGVGNDSINVAQVIVQANTNNILGLENKQVLGETSPASPCAYSDGFGTILAWAGSGNNDLNLMISPPNPNLVFQHKITLGETSPVAPALTSLLSSDAPILAWTGSGNKNINVAVLGRASVPTAAPTGITYKTTLGETSSVSPALCPVDFVAYSGCFYLAWVGLGNNNLNVMVSCDAGKTFVSKFTSPETSSFTPSLCSRNGTTFIAWTGTGNDRINIAQLDSSSLPPAP